MGVWIETLPKIRTNVLDKVTPFVGVWIETTNIKIKRQIIAVTPFVGVWIETEKILIILYHYKGHTLRGCVD